MEDGMEDESTGATPQDAGTQDVKQEEEQPAYPPGYRPYTGLEGSGSPLGSGEDKLSNTLESNIVDNAHGVFPQEMEPSINIDANPDERAELREEYRDR